MHESSRLTTAPPIVSGFGTGLFVGAGEIIVRLDRETGDVKWERRLFGQVPGIAGTQSVPFVVATEDGDVYALSPSTGDGFWRTALPDYCQCGPTTVGGRTFVGCFDGNPYALGRRGQIE